MAIRYKTLFSLSALWLFSMSMALAQDELLVQGQITSADEPGGFPGVSVSIKGTTIGTMTDARGRYSITVTSRQSILVFSSVGYLSTEMPVGNQNTIDVRLSPEVVSLDEVVVVGYGTQRRTDITGAISTVGGKEVTRHLSYKPIHYTKIYLSRHEGYQKKFSFK